MTEFIEQLEIDLQNIRKDMKREIKNMEADVSRIEAALREINVPNVVPIRRKPTKATLKVGDGVIAGSVSGEVI